jgi:hypothetical protein
MAAFENLSLLRAFVCIVESGSISAGARRLKLPQPTLSRYLQQLEQQAGAALLRRDTHRMSLTETGHRLLAMLGQCWLWRKTPNSGYMKIKPRCAGICVCLRRSTLDKLW